MRTHNISSKIYKVINHIYHDFITFHVCITIWKYKSEKSKWRLFNQRRIVNTCMKKEMTTAYEGKICYAFNVVHKLFYDMQHKKDWRMKWRDNERAFKACYIRHIYVLCCFKTAKMQTISSKQDGKNKQTHQLFFSFSSFLCCLRIFIFEHKKVLLASM